MQSLFSKFFKNDKEEEKNQAAEQPAVENKEPETKQEPAPARSEGTTEMEQPKARKVIKAPIMLDEDEQPQANADGDIMIKARPDQAYPENCIFMLDRPVFKGHSAYFANKESAAEAPLAQAIFEISTVENITIWDTNIIVGRDPSIYDDWKPKAVEIGAKIREQLNSDQPAIEQSYIDKIPSEDEIREKIQVVLDNDINPGIAAHSGVITLLDVTGNTVKINMGGGCQGCAASTITLKQGIHAAFRDAVPQVGAIIDDTDHSAGENPYFQEIPQGMM